MSEVKPLVSVIMNCHNGGKFLEQSINSIILQTYKNWELIFWDNVSQDESKKILNKFSDNRIKYFKSQKFNRLYESRNLAIQNARGEFISFLDTDDMWQKDKLEKQMNFFFQKIKIMKLYTLIITFTTNLRKKNLLSLKTPFKWNCI